MLSTDSELRGDLTPAELEALGAMPGINLKKAVGGVICLFLLFFASGWLWQAFERHRATYNALESSLEKVLQEPGGTPQQIDYNTARWVGWQKEISIEYGMGTQRRVELSNKSEQVRMALAAAVAEQMTRQGSIDVADEVLMAVDLHILSQGGSANLKVIGDKIAGRVRGDAVAWLTTLVKSNDREELVRGSRVARSLAALSSPEEAGALLTIADRLNQRTSVMGSGGGNRPEMARALTGLYQGVSVGSIESGGNEDRVIVVHGQGSVQELVGPLVGTENMRARLREAGFGAVEVYGADGHHEFDLVTGAQVDVEKQSNPKNSPQNNPQNNQQGGE